MHRWCKVYSFDPLEIRRFCDSWALELETRLSSVTRTSSVNKHNFVKNMVSSITGVSSIIWIIFCSTLILQKAFIQGTV